MEITQETIKAKVSNNPKWASRAIVALYNYQTAEEQSYELTKEKNGVGFNGVDAEILSSFAKQILRGRTLSEKQLAIAYKKLPKYSNQLWRLSQPQPEPQPEPEPEPTGDLVLEVSEFNYIGKVAADRKSVIVYGTVWQFITATYDRDNDMLSLEYKSNDGRKLTILND